MAEHLVCGSVMDVLQQLVKQLQLTDGSSYVIKKGVTYYLEFESSVNGGDSCTVPIAYFPNGAVEFNTT